MNAQISGVVDRLYSMWRVPRSPDYQVGTDQSPYLQRWCVLPKRERGLNVWLHKISRSDDDRALHDHRGHNVSIILRGRYIEHFANGVAKLRTPGCITFRKATTPHRLEIPTGHGPVWTIFLSWHFREWGFHCEKDWVHSDDYFINGGC